MKILSPLTGFLRPGKSYPLGMLVPENLDETWRDWCNKRQASVLASLRAAIAKAKGEVTALICPENVARRVKWEAEEVL